MKKQIVLVLYNIRSRFNVGAIFRTADAAGVKKIYLTGLTPSPPHPRIEKVSLGAEKSVPFENYFQTARVLKKLKKSNYQIIALEQSKNSFPYYQFKYSRPTALLLGNEVNGIPARLLKLCSQILEIPMHGQKKSLNVSIAAGIVMFSIINSRSTY